MRLCDCYLPLTKLREGNVFTGVCYSVQAGGYAHSQVSSGVGGYAWFQVPGTRPPEGTTTVMYTPPVLTSSGDHRSGRYASYCNAFFFAVLVIPACQTFVKKKFYNGTGNYRNELPIEMKFCEKEIISCFFAICPRNQILFRFRFKHSDLISLRPLLFHLIFKRTFYACFSK